MRKPNFLKSKYEKRIERISGFYATCLNFAIAVKDYNDRKEHERLELENLELKNKLIKSQLNKRDYK